MATPELIPCKAFLESISRHPEIWETNSYSRERKRVAAAWKQVCLDTWPADFESWTADQKRKRCLALQLKWNTIHKDFMKAQENGNSNRTMVAYEHLLSFLLADKKRSARSRSRSRSRSKSPEDAEDRHFMLSLVSHMKEVPRASKLALREDMLRLVRKYTPQHQSDQTFDHS